MNSKLLLQRRAVSAQRRSQGGIATILILLMVGLSLSAAVLGVMYYIRGTQDKLTTVHAQTQAQLRTWSGVEAVRQYLYQVNEDSKLKTLAALVSANGTNPTTLAIAGLSDVSAKVVSVDSATNPSQFTVDVTGLSSVGTQAQSSSTVRAVFAVVPSVAAGGNPSVITFNKNLRLSGEVKIEIDAGSTQGANISVGGDLSTSGNNITGVSKLNVTGSVSIGSGSNFDEINANCDVQLTGSVKSKVINARRNVCLDGQAAGTTTINANGSVLAKTSYNTNGDIAAIGNPTDVGSCRAPGSAEDTTNSYAATCPVPDASYVVDMGEAYAKSVQAKGSVRLKRNYIGNIKGAGNLLVDWGTSVGGGDIAGQVTTPQGALSAYSDKAKIKVNENRSTLTVAIPSVSRVTLTSEIVDANDYKDIANYLFTVDASGYKKVTVNNVNGITDGTYYIGSFATNQHDKNDYLCKTLSSGATKDSAVCASSEESTSKRICKGNSDQNTCFDYNSGSSTWTITGKSLAQGIAWFDGSLVVSSGTFYNTFISPSNISTSGSTKVYAPNYAGYSGTADGMTYSPTGICSNSFFPSLFPKQFCDTENSAYLPDVYNGLGNYAFIAGSVKNGHYVDNSSYLGGNIATGASTDVYGSIKAGNEFYSSGDTTVHGYISALAAGVNVHNSLGAKTTINLTKLPITFKPIGGTSGSSGGGSTTGGISLKWARYL